METEQLNLPELRDIHLPEGVSAWPPAYGWWVIFLGIVLAVLIFHIVKVIRRKSKKLYALHLLKNIYCNNTVAAVVEMSAILRRICVFKYPGAAVLSGTPWLDFLNSRSKHKIDGKPAELLINAPYMKEGAKGFSSADVLAVRAFCQNWIGENL